MLPNIDERGNIVLVDTFTTKFVRKPKVDEIIHADNPFKPADSIVKRVIAVEGEYVDFLDVRSQRLVKVLVPPNHIWVEGDNKGNSRDSREFGPLSLGLVHGLVRTRLWPLYKFGNIKPSIS